MTKLEEFKRGWTQLIAATLGLGIGVIGLGSYNLGLFAKDLSISIGLTKTQYGAGYAAFTLGLALGLQMWGRMLTRFGAAKTTAGSALAMALCFVALAKVTTSPEAYIAIVGCIGFFGGATSGITFTRTISGWFDRGRGFALGLTQIGLGMSGAVVPLGVSRIIRDYGWSNGYLALAALAALGAPVALVLLRLRQGGGGAEQVSLQGIERAEQVAVQFAEAKRSRVFWTLLLAFSLTTLFVSGASQHLVPMLRELGSSPAKAAAYISLTGIGTICVRLVFGWLSDLVHAPWLMAISCLVGACGMLLVAWGGLAYAPVYAFALGWAFGGEIDLIAYMTTRYFGLAIFPRVYAWQYGALSIFAGISPFAIGWLADTFKSYEPGLFISASLAVIAAGLFLTLPRYRIHVGLEDETGAEQLSTPVNVH